MMNKGKRMENKQPLGKEKEDNDTRQWEMLLLSEFSTNNYTLQENRYLSHQLSIISMTRLKRRLFFNLIHSSVKYPEPVSSDYH